MKLSAEQIGKLKSLIDKMSTHVEREEGNKYVQVNEKFHDLINRSAGNQVTYEIYRTLHKQSLWHRIHFLTFPRTLKRSLSEHRKILDALIQKNPGLAECLMKKHLKYSESVLVEHLENKTRDELQRRKKSQVVREKREEGPLSVNSGLGHG